MVSLLRGWIVLCAVITATGWIASWFGALNRGAYIVAIVLCGIPAIFRVRGMRVSLGNWRRRFSRPLPLLYVVLAALSIVGGFSYLPTNVDGLSYRIPRVLHWLSEQRWHWIHSADIRLNVVATGFDWLSAPLLLFTKTERSIVVLNAVSFLLLPGALFLALSRLGLKRRVAAAWMWVLPAGFCYFMQAGSIANDMYAAVFALCAIGFALRAGERRKLGDLCISVLALALVTGAKQTNIPFALPWLIAAWPALRLAKQQISLSILVSVVAVLASILPITALNVLHGHPAQGFAPGQDFSPKNPFWGVVGNSFWIAFSNLQPPVAPWASKWNELRARFVQSDLGEPFRSFEAFGHLHRAASEQFAGLGCFVTLLVLASWWVGRSGCSIGLSLRQKWIAGSIILGFLVFMAKVGVNQCPRYLAPWYPFLCAFLLLSARQLAVVRSRWWTSAAVGVLLLSVALTVLSRQRPLFPAQTLLESTGGRFGRSGIFQKIFRSYAFAEQVRTELNPFLRQIPQDVRWIGYAVRFGEKEPFLWKPFFTRRVLRVLNSDTPEQLRAKGLRYVVVGPSALTTLHDFVVVQEAPSERSGISSLEEWLNAYDAELISTGEYRLAPEGPVEKLHLVKLR